MVSSQGYMLVPVYTNTLYSYDIQVLPMSTERKFITMVQNKVVFWVFF